MTIIVVARYNENVEWTKQFSNTLIYNKGVAINDGYNEILLDNVGREGHTYYKYICDNYDNLEDYTVFTQGDPFDHSPDIIEHLHKFINNKEMDSEFEFLSKYIYHCNLSGCRLHSELPLIDVYEKLFGERKTNMLFKFGTGGQFIVSKNRILKRPKSFYLKIVEMLEYSKNPIEGFVIERFHSVIFATI